MAWIKMGRIYTPRGDRDWRRSHAQVPTIFAVDTNRWRIYFGTRDRRNRTLTTFIDVAAGDPEKILYEHDRPILPLGGIGTFDDCGVMPSWCLAVGDLTYLYYIGWTVRNTIPYHNAIGLAISADGGFSFKRFSDGPLFSPTHREPYFTGTSCVLLEDGVWKNWYLSCTKWEILDGTPEPFYHIKYAESADGIHWKRNGEVAIDYKADDEGGIVKASVLKENGTYHMWYSARKKRDYRENILNSYRIGYAESPDGKQWERKDDTISLSPSPNGWDSLMLAYPHVITHEGKRYLFYNGNGFGKTGIGYAIEVND